MGARLYYVAFAWDNYKNNLLSILNLREGGLAIYGGVLAGALTCYIICRIKKQSFMNMADIIMPGVLVGQILGRWGNFFNREVFGQYTDNLVAMELPTDAVRTMDEITPEMMAHSRTVDGVMYVQVHPTFLYESLWNLALLVLLLWVTKHKKFHGQIFWMYLFGYGLGRCWIEAVRTDQLMLWGTGIPVSRALALVMMIVSGFAIMYQLRKGREK